MSWTEEKTSNDKAMALIGLQNVEAELQKNNVLVKQLRQENERYRKNVNASLENMRLELLTEQRNSLKNLESELSRRIGEALVSDVKQEYGEAVKKQVSDQVELAWQKAHFQIDQKIYGEHQNLKDLEQRQEQIKANYMNLEGLIQNKVEKRAEENKLEVLKEIVMVIGLAMVLFSSLAFAYLLIKFIFGAAIGTVWTSFFKFASLGHLTGVKAAGLVAFQVLLKLLSTLFILLAGIGLYFLPLGLYQKVLKWSGKKDTRVMHAISETFKDVLYLPKKIKADCRERKFQRSFKKHKK